ncbi:MAG TPA: NAD-dependent epimerase/dehydratase family protein, partial [Fibrobacteraceae bacterium]|nr:NAD-dependent epimerase/dehydratase family protein [Fibrobacteraceae bacterium]
MRILFIGGTGTISMAISKKLLADGHTLYLINRGTRNDLLEGDIHSIVVSDINNEAEVKEKIKDLTFDVVADFIAFVPAQ